MQGLSLVGIDASITSTAVCVLDASTGRETYMNFTKYKTTGKWYKLLDGRVDYHHLSYLEHDDYSTGELYKALRYGEVAGEIVAAIREAVGDNRVIATMEGYSYSSAAGDLIDLVTFGTSVRQRLINMLTEDVSGGLIIKAPSSLKKYACESVYAHLVDEKTRSKKSFVCRNDEGIAGGSFTKREMLKAAADWDEARCGLTATMGATVDDVLMMKNVPKPVDDLVDAWFLSRWSLRHATGSDTLAPSIYKLS